MSATIRTLFLFVFVFDNNNSNNEMEQLENHQTSNCNEQVCVCQRNACMRMDSVSLIRTRQRAKTHGQDQYQAHTEIHSQSWNGNHAIAVTELHMNITHIRKICRSLYVTTWHIPSISAQLLPGFPASQTTLEIQKTEPHTELSACKR